MFSVKNKDTKTVLIYFVLLSLLFTLKASSTTSSTLNFFYPKFERVMIWWVGSGSTTVESLLLFDLFDLLFLDQIWRWKNSANGEHERALYKFLSVQTFLYCLIVNT